MENYRIVNLEEGHPPLKTALDRLTREVYTARRHQIAVLKLIHGYGSSGAGGKLRIAARKALGSLIARGYIDCMIEGERLSIFDSDTRRALTLCPSLRQDSDLDRHNNGITLVILKKQRK